MYQPHQQVHFVGIGGIGMSGIAEVLINLGHRVTGSDLKASDTTERLVSLGAQVQIGHHPDHVAGADVVVVSSAVKGDNPEVIGAREHLIPVIQRAEMLAELMRLKYGIAVAGAHGKTTATSMVATLLGEGGLDPTVVVGGKLNALGSNARLGTGEFLVAEADESDGSFTRLSPAVVLVTNVDSEHLDHYGSEEALDRAFVEFMNLVPFYGAAVICLDDPRLAGLIPQVRRRTITYGLTGQADFQARDLEAKDAGGRFNLVIKGQPAGRVEVPMPGKHNVLNMLGALAAAVEVGVPLDKAMAACAKCGGVGRRFELKGQAPCGAPIIDDYAHHPTEIKATLEAARQVYPQRRLVICFQPHRYSRTQALKDLFATAFYGADELLVTDIYPAGEARIEGVDAEGLSEVIRAHGHRSVTHVGTLDAAGEWLDKNLGPGDLLITMGAGSVWQVGARLAADGGREGVR